MDLNDLGEQIIITTFINCHLFWFIEVRDVMVRNALSRNFKALQNLVRIQNPADLQEGEIVLVYVENIWARAFTFTIAQDQAQPERITFVCWLVDHGVMREVECVYKLPSGFETCPHLAKQGSLHKVVNVTKDITWDVIDLALVQTKTIEHLDAVRLGALDEIEKAKKIFFSILREDQFNEYGDIIILTKDDKYESLTEKMIEKELLVKDEQLSLEIEPSRDIYFEQFFFHRRNWFQHLDNCDRKNLEEKIFNTESHKIFHMEYFDRQSLI